MSFRLLLDEKLILLKDECENCKNSITEISELLIKKGCVTEEFIKATLEREEKYPTGLPTKIGVAIPHPPPDPTYIKRNSIGVGVYRRPVYFKRMDDPEKTVPVNIVILFSLMEEEGYVKFLQKLVSIFQKPEILEEIMRGTNKHEIIKILKKELIDYII